MILIPISTGVGVAQSVQQWGTGRMAWARFPAGQDFSLLHTVQTESRAHPASYPMGSRGIFLRG
jgi:hypothetical protein